jgi:hypothetical protein
VADRVQLERYLGDGPILRDDRPIVEYFLSLPEDTSPADLTPYRCSPDAIIDATP